MLPAVGTVSYNGHTFSGACRHRISATPVYDEAGRTVVYTIYRLSATDFVFDTTDASTSMESIRRSLSKPGQTLTYTGTGFGDLSVNTSLNPTSKSDVVWGPKPTQISFTPMGTARAWRIEWTCEVAIPECSTARYRNRVLAYNYEVNYAIDEAGFTTRTYSGYIEIPMTRIPSGSRQVPDSADLYRERVNPPLAPGFRREPGRFHLSKDKRRLDFTIIDREVPIDSLAEGCVSATGSISISNVSPQNLNQWNGRISATYTLPKLSSKLVAWLRFFQLIEDRLKVVQDGGAKPLLHGFSITEGIYANDREQSFEISYVFTMPLETILKASGIWRRVPGTNWSLWAASMGSVIGPRGSAGLYHRPQDDAIIDLCLSESPQLLQGGSVPSPQGPVSGVRTMRGGGGAETSWLMYKCWIEMDGDPGTVSMKTLPSGTASSMSSSPVAQAAMSRSADSGGGGSAGGADGGDILADIVVGMFGSKAASADFTPEQKSWAFLNEKTRLLYLRDIADTKMANDILRQQILSSLGSGSRKVAEQTDALNKMKDESISVDRSAKINSGLTGSGSSGAPGEGSQLGRSGTIVQQRTVRKYYCRLMGMALRAGYPIPIPSVTKVGGATAFPRPGHAAKVNQIITANWGGVPIYYATWNIPYELASAPDGNIPYPANPFLALG